MTIPPHPPRGLRWVEKWPTRAGVIFLAVISLILSIYVAYQYAALVDCLRFNDEADQRRTAAIAIATTVERQRQAALISAPNKELAAIARAGVIAAYAETDRVRAANPPVTRRCG